MMAWSKGYDLEKLEVLKKIKCFLVDMDGTIFIEDPQAGLTLVITWACIAQPWI